MEGQEVGKPDLLWTSMPDACGGTYHLGPSLDVRADRWLGLTGQIPAGQRCGLWHLPPPQPPWCSYAGPWGTEHEDR